MTSKKVEKTAATSVSSQNGQNSSALKLVGRAGCARLNNQAILSFLNSEWFRDWRGATSDQVKKMAEKMNGIAQTDPDFFGDSYEVRF